MRLAYLDSSVLVAIAFAKPGATAIADRIRRFDLLVAADLHDAELRAAFHREELPADPSLTAAISWIVPDRPLRPEIDQVLRHGALRGADCWHLAAALYLAGTPEALTFLTLDTRQHRAALALGFAT